MSVRPSSALDQQRRFARVDRVGGRTPHFQCHRARSVSIPVRITSVWARIAPQVFSIDHSTMSLPPLGDHVFEVIIEAFEERPRSIRAAAARASAPLPGTSRRVRSGSVGRSRRRWRSFEGGTDRLPGDMPSRTYRRLPLGTAHRGTRVRVSMRRARYHRTWS